MKRNKEARKLSSKLWRKHVQMFDEVVNQYKNREGVFVDGGCGRERFLQRYSENFKYCLGFDIRLDRGQHNSDNVYYSYGDLEYIPLKDDSVDVFLTNFVLEHIKHPERFFDEVCRVIKPNGVFVSWTPNANSPAGTLLRILPVSMTRTLKRLLLKSPEYCPTFYRANSVSKLDRMMRKAGFLRTNLQLIDSVFYFPESRVVRWLHNVFIRLSNHGWLRYYKDILFTVYVKPESYQSSGSMCGRRPSHFPAKVLGNSY